LEEKKIAASQEETANAILGGEVSFFTQKDKQV
jgi:hypothetical protein